MQLKKEIYDVRWYQILFLLSFLALGNLWVGWVVIPSKYLFIFSSCLLTQYIGCRFTGLSLASLKSALISALGLSLLLHADRWWIYTLAGFLAVSSKFIFKFNKKHFFNPANFAIIVVISLTNHAWVSTGQWGSNLLYLLLFCALGLTVVGKVGRIETSLTYLIIYLGLEYTRQVLYLGWGIEVVLHKLMNGTLMLFAFFMITDPRTIPNHFGVRVVWTSLIAIVSFYLINFYQLYSAPLWTLFCFSMLTPIADYYFTAQRFEWLNLKVVSTNNIN